MKIIAQTRQVLINSGAISPVQKQPVIRGENKVSPVLSRLNAILARRQSTSHKEK